MKKRLLPLDPRSTSHSQLFPAFKNLVSSLESREKAQCQINPSPHQPVAQSWWNPGEMLKKTNSPKVFPREEKAIADG
jgi:hypothetical protein